MSRKFWSLAARCGKKKALIAIARRMLVIIFCMISRKEPFRQPQLI
ncbi:Mobile element protein [Geobacillus stearothermophilus]|uniref:Mobile element protein n=1 Tax=Geobacillus stearothermophilus TaxID=1422 RepID=A0ABQ7HAZ3_GEOSE|nr:Mobile element protein [Geobacillus stearothermophilus]